MRSTLLTSILCLAAATHLHAASTLDTAKIEAITGLKGKLNDAKDVFKVSVPRTDVKISVDGWTMPPFMGLTSWAAFTPGKAAEAMVMGDLVLFQDEVNPAMSAALDAGLTVTALHNHFFFAEPAVFFMHIGGEGTTETLATGVKAALDKVKEIRGAHVEIAKDFGKPLGAATSSISGEKISAIFGAKGEAKEGMFKVTIGREAKMPCGCEVGKDMGVNTWAAFAGTDDNAIVDGDFVVRGEELQTVLKSLRKDGVNIVAIHQHMAMEEPRYLFLHYWGRGPAADLAKAVKSALAKTEAKR